MRRSRVRKFKKKRTTIVPITCSFMAVQLLFLNLNHMTSDTNALFTHAVENPNTFTASWESTEEANEPIVTEEEEKEANTNSNP